MFACRVSRSSLGLGLRHFTSVRRSGRSVARCPAYSVPPVRVQANVGWQTAYRRFQIRQYARQAFNYQRFQASRSLFNRWAARPTFYYEIGGIGVACGGYYAYNCETVPVTGRIRFNVVSPESEKSQGDQLFQQTLQEYGQRVMPDNSKEHRLVQRVLDRLIPHSGLEGEKWEVHVIDDDQKNAFVIPGGKVFVFRGILDVAQTEDGLAAVLGHEIAHNVAHHAAERMSQFVILLPVGFLVAAFGGIDPGIVNGISNLAFSLPGSRKQEREADYIGLMMMAESCYDPSAAMGLWSRMEKAEQGAPPQFLSTHPSSHNRLGKIQGWLPEAEAKRESSECGTLPAYADDFRRTIGLERWNG